MSLNFRFQFLGPFLAGKWAWPPRQCPRVWGLKTRPKSLPTLGSFWVTWYLKIVFPNFQTLDPPLIWVFQVLVSSIRFKWAWSDIPPAYISHSYCSIKTRLTDFVHFVCLVLEYLAMVHNKKQLIMIKYKSLPQDSTRFHLPIFVSYLPISLFDF